MQEPENTKPLSKKEIKNKKLSKRILELDLMRFIAIMFMVADHLMYDLGVLMGNIFSDFPGTNPIANNVVLSALWYRSWDVRISFRIFILIIFFGLTGLCCAFSKNNLKRGLRLGVVSLVITLATYILGIIMKDPEMMVTFGVLHCISFGLIIIGLLEKFIKDKKVYLVIGLCLIIVGCILYPYPRILYSDDNFVMVVLKQIAGLGRAGSDSFPFPIYGGMMFLGAFFSSILYPTKTSLFHFKYHNNIITFIGRNTLAVYVGHQVLLPVIVGIILLIAGFHLAL